MDDGNPPPPTQLQDFLAWFEGSVARGQAGRPLIVYCPEKGLAARKAGKALIFTGLDGAVERAIEHDRDKRTAESPHVVPVHLALRNPLIQDPDEPSVDFFRLSAVLGSQKAATIAKQLAGEIQESDLWAEEFASEFESVEALLLEDPERLGPVTVPVAQVLAESEWIDWLREAGIDGSIHASMHSRPERTYQVFDPDQVRSALQLDIGLEKAPSIPAGPYPVSGESAPADYLRNPDGSPQVFYRGEESGELYTRFDSRLTREKVGFFFAEGVDHAALYGLAGKVAPRAFLIRSERLLDVTDPYAPHCRKFLRRFAAEFDSWIDRGSGEGRSVESFLEAGDLYHYEGWGAERWRHLFRFAARQGYDAVRVLDCTDGVPMSTVLVAVDENQIEFAPTGFTQAPKESTPSFQKWFRGSTIRDETGAPQIVYHGTAADFDTFSKAKAKDLEGRQLGLGWGKGKFYFTRNPESAGIAAKAAEIRGKGGHPSVVPVYLKVTRPVLAERYLGQVERELAKGRTRDQAIAVVDRKLKRLGYDGIVDPLSGGFAVFEPQQIKSALGNFGGFSPESPSILMSADPSTPFGSWFEGSQVVDPAGRPKRLFHGTGAPKDFAAFRPQGDLGFHFGDADQANDRLDNLARPGVEPGPARLMPVYLAIRNPLRLPDVGDWSVDNLVDHLVERFPADEFSIAHLRTSEQVRDFLAEKGFDGVVYRNTNEGPGSDPHRRAVEESWERLGAVRAGNGRDAGVFAPEDESLPEYQAFAAARAAYAAHREATAEDSYIAFWPEQVKSAIGNRGTFDPAKSSILASTEAKPGFSSWFGESKVVAPDGKPMVLYHGTTATFDAFDSSKRHFEGSVGRGFYFSSSPDDVAKNYATIGPDLTFKIEDQTDKLADAMANDPSLADLDHDELRQKARAEVESWYLQHQGLTIPVYLSIQNPAVIGGRDETILTIDDSGPDDDAPTGTLIEFARALRIASRSFYGSDLEESLGRLTQSCIDNGGAIGLTDATAILFSDTSLSQWYDDDGNHADREMVRRALEAMGFDGVIDRTVHQKFGPMTPVDTSHYIAFRGSQIKSAIANLGSYDPQDPSILRSADNDPNRTGGVLRDSAGQPRVFFTGATRRGFHPPTTAAERELGQKALPFDLLTERPDSKHAASLVSNLRNPLRIDWTDEAGNPMPASQPSQGFLNLHDAIRSATLKGHDGLIVYGLQGKTDGGRDYGPVSYIPLSARCVQPVEPAQDQGLLVRQVRAGLRRALRDPEIAGLFGNVGPFDGGCLAAAKALIVVAQRGDLIRIDSEHGPEHYGARIDGRIHDFSGAYETEQQWLETFRRREAAVVVGRTLRVADGWVDSEIPDRPEATSRIADRLKAIGLSFDVPPTPAQRFSAWFGNSQITTALGTPKVVFHGSGAPGFARFDPALRGSATQTDDAREGFFFAANPRSAEQFTWRDGEKRGAIYPVYLRVESPLVVTDITLDGSHSKRVAERIRLAKALGHDGVIFAQSDMLGHAGEVYVAFEPEQIKSAVGNLGAYDPKDPSILGSAQRHFDRWFGDSKVVDARGAPQVVFHGTKAGPFRVFDTSREGAHFGSEEQAGARGRVPGGEGNPRQIRAYLSIQNPLDLPDLGTWDRFQTVFNHLSASGVLSSEEADRAWANWQRGDDEGWTALKGMLRAKGFDGIRYSNEVEGRGTSFIAFEPTQIKSADANSGRFSPRDPSIYASSPDAASTEMPVYDVRSRGLGMRRPLELGPRASADLPQIADQLEKQGLVEDGGRWADEISVDGLQQALLAMAPVSDEATSRGALERAGIPIEVQQHLIDDARRGLLQTRLAALGFDGVTYQDLKTGSDAYLHLGATAPKSGRFAEWFGESQMVDSRGSPLVLYHGTDADFDTFDLAQAGSRTDDGQLGRGFYFSTDPRVPDGKSLAMPVYVRAENPLTLQLADFRTNKAELIRSALSLPADADSHAVRASLLERGHDSVVLDYGPTGYAHREVMALHAGQVKSAIGNVGSFARESDSILMSGDSSKRRRADVVVERSGRMYEARVGKKVVGRAYPWEDSRGKFVMMDVAVSAPFRQRGVARAMYEAVEKDAGRPLEPAVSLSDDGFEFWKRFRPEAVAHDLRHRKEELIGQRVWFRDQEGIIEQAVGRVAIARNASGTTTCLKSDQIEDAIQQARERAASRTAESPQFQTWFDQSQVRAADGRPQVVFHGSRVPEIERFDLGMEGTGAVNVGSRKLGGFWFTSSRTNAAFFADGRDHTLADTEGVHSYGHDATGHFAAVADAEGDRLFEVGPYPDPEAAEAAGRAAALRYNARPSRGDAIVDVYLSMKNPLVLEGVVPREREFDAARAGGHDGIIARNVVDGAEHGDVFVAFDPEQIKSASENIGRFDPEDPAIRMSTSPSSSPFEQWFGRSKVKDAAGKPLVLYHGSALEGMTDTTDITAFDPARTGDRFRADDAGFFFSNDPRIANYYARSDADWREPGSGAGAIYPVFVSLQRPLVIDGAFLRKQNMDPIGIREDTVTFWDQYQALIKEWVLEAGADGVILRDAVQKVNGTPVQTVIAFKPEQIKSAIGNRGTFDPVQPSILMSTSTATAQASRPAPLMQWLGDSKVVDGEGKPLVVYHGTNQNFQVFSAKRLGANTGAISAKGFFFTENAAEATEYADMAARKQVSNAEEAEANAARLLRAIDRANDRRDFDLAEKLTHELEESEREGMSGEERGANVLPVYLSISHPKVVDFQGSVDLVRLSKEIEDAKAEGFDGLRLDNVFDAVTERPVQFETTQWIAFHPEQIKSAIGNRGTYDPKNPSILMSAPLGGQTRVADCDGKPLIVYRGEHGPNAHRFNSRLGSLTFSSAVAASQYALSPNDARDSGEFPRVFAAFLSIRSPALENRDDPFMDLAEVADKLGHDKAEAIARSLAGPIEDLGLWKDQFADRFGSVGAMLDRDPDSVRQLYVDAYRIFDRPEFVAWFREAGYDGALHVGNGATHDEIEYRVFDERQIRSIWDDQPTILASGPRLPLREARVVRVEGAAEGLSMFVAPVNDPAIVARIGQETVVRETAGMTKTVGERFRTREGLIVGGRYLARSPDGHVIGALNFTIRGKDAIVSNLYVAPEHRRQGVASRLVEWARADMPRITADAAMSRDGAAFMGYESAVETSTAPAAIDQWLGQSVLRHASGQPMRVFHGTNKPPESFSPKRDGLVSTIFGTEKVERYGIFMTPDSEVSSAFAESHGLDGAAVMPLYARIERPLDMTQGYTDELFNRIWAWGNKEDLDGYRVARYLGDHWGDWMLFDADGGNDPAFVVRMLKELGYDGVKFIEPAVPGERVSGEAYVAFDPEQVKSAVGNSGGFDPANPSILASTSPVGPTRLPTFKVWFGSSQVLDPDGNPRVVFHGTAIGGPRAVAVGNALPARAFEIFSKKMRGSVTESSDSKVGFWFSADRARADAAAADAVAVQPEASAYVYQVYLSIQNPLRVDSIKDRDPAEVARIARVAKRAGHDGLIFEDGEGEGADYLVFEPEQIKAAFGNRGTFAPGDPSIVMSAPAQSAVLDNPFFRQWFGPSKVVSRDGSPAVMYHSGSFDEFEEANPTIGDAGFHFGTKAAAEERDGGKRIDDFVRALKVEKAPNEEGLDAWFWSSDREDSYDHDPAGHATEAAARADAEQFALGMDFTFAEPMPLTAAYLSIANPKRIADQVDDWSDAIERAKAEGFDGIVYRNQFEDKGSDSWVAFYPWQVKSIQNEGTFRRDDPSILRSSPEKAGELPSPFERWFNGSRITDRDGKPLRVFHGTADSFEIFQSKAYKGVYRADGDEIEKADAWDMGDDGLGSPDRYHYMALGDAAQLGADAALEMRRSEAQRRNPDGDFAPDTARLLRDLGRLQGKVVTATTERRPTKDGFYFTPSQSYSYIRDIGREEGGHVVPVYLNIKNPIFLDASQIEMAGLADRIEKYKAQGYDGAVFANDPADLEKHGIGGATQIVAFSPTQIKSAIGNRGQYRDDDPSILASREKASLSSSSLSDVIASHPQERCAARRWREMLPTWRGVDIDALAWSGLDGWLLEVDRCARAPSRSRTASQIELLRRHPEGEVSRDELLGYLAAEDRNFHLDVRRSEGDALRFAMTMCEAGREAILERGIHRLWEQIQARPSFPVDLDAASQVRWAQIHAKGLHDRWHELVNEQTRLDPSTASGTRKGDRLIEIEVAATRRADVLHLDAIHVRQGEHSSAEPDSRMVESTIRQALQWAAEHGHQRIQVSQTLGKAIRDREGFLRTYAEQWGGTVVGEDVDGLSISVTSAMVQSARARRRFFRMGESLSSPLPASSGRAHRSDVLVSPALQVAEQRLAVQGIHVSLDWGDGRDVRGLAKVAHSFGRRLVPYKLRSGSQDLNGFVLPDDPNTVYVNLHSRFAMRAVIGHELSHSIFMKDRKGYDKLMAIARRHHVGPAPLTEETLCDFIGRKFTDPRFMLSVEREKPSLFQKLMASAKAVLGKVQNVMKKAPDLYQANEIKDCAEMREAATILLRGHIKAATLDRRPSSAPRPMALPHSGVPSPEPP